MSYAEDNQPRSLRDAGIRQRLQSMLSEPRIAPLTKFVADLRKRHHPWKVPDLDPRDGDHAAEPGVGDGLCPKILRPRLVLFRCPVGSTAVEVRRWISLAAIELATSKEWQPKRGRREWVDLVCRLAFADCPRNAGGLDQSISWTRLDGSRPNLSFCR